MGRPDYKQLAVDLERPQFTDRQGKRTMTLADILGEMVLDLHERLKRVEEKLVGDENV